LLWLKTSVSLTRHDKDNNNDDDDDDDDDDNDDEKSEGKRAAARPNKSCDIKGDGQVGTDTKNKKQPG